MMESTSHTKLTRALCTAGLALALLALGLVWLSMTATLTHAQASTIYVDGLQGTDQPGCGSSPGPSACDTIGYALAASSPGDTVSVAPAVYTETLSMQSGVVISGTDATTTIIDGNGSGPVVLASGSTITGSAVLRSFTVRGGFATSGGALSITGGASPLVEDCLVYDNLATENGGGILIDASSPVISNTQVVSNTASRGGGIYIDGGASAYIQAAIVSRNVATGTASFDGGGGLYVLGSSPGITGTQILSNTAAQFGGGLYAYNSIVLTNTQIVSNTAGQYGGGLYQYTLDGQVDMLGGRFERNVATQYDGGGAYIRGNLSITGTQVVDNTGARWGGGLFVNADAILTDVQVIGNTAGQWGGGLYQNLFVDQIVVTDSLFERNAATGTYPGDAKAGGLFASSPASLYGTVLTDNTTVGYGGGLYVAISAFLSDTTVISNTAGLDGGGLRHSDTTGERVAIVNSRFERNQALDGSGGGLYSRSTAVLTQTQIVSNTAGLWGGGLYVNLGTILSATQVLGNTAYDGGGLHQYDRDGWVYASDTQFERNTTTGGDGGGMRVLGSATLFRSRVVNNSARWGGGLRINATAILTDVVVTGNAATAWGGGLYQNNLDGVAEVTGSYFDSNVAGSYDGGGLYIRGTASLAQTQVVNNTAGRWGGGLYALNAADVTNTILADNIAPYGAAIYLEGTSGTQMLRHLTVASSPPGSNSAIHVISGTVGITNTIVASYTTGIRQIDGSVNEDYNLYYGNGTDINSTGGALVSGGNSLSGEDPRFLDPAGGDFHLGAGSAAIKAGIDIGVTEDIDGEPRVAPPDIGADEVVPVVAVGKSGPAWFNLGTTVTYTLRVTNTHAGTAYNVLLTDTVPIGANFVDASHGGSEAGGEVSWPLFDVPPDGGVITRTFVVAANDTITNDDYMATVQGLPGVAGTTSVTSIINHPPSADAGVPQTVRPSTVTLDGSGSSDTDGDALTYHWEQTGGTPVTLSDPAADSPTFDSPITGDVLTFQLVVTDTFGLDDLDTTTVTVTNQAPIADAGAPQSVHSGTVTLDGSGSSDPDTDTLTYHWEQTGGTAVTLSNPDATSPTFTAPLVAGELSFSLTVTDTFGLDNVDTTTVTISNGAPIAEAGLPQTVHTGTVTLDGTGSSDPDSDDLLFHWVQTDGTTVTLSDDTAPSPTFTAPLIEGVLTFSLTVTDTFGLDNVDTTTVTISNGAPIAEAGLPQTVHTGTVTLDGTGSSDPDGDDLLYHWMQTDGTSVALSDPTAARPTFTAPIIEGVLTFSLTVTDTFGLDNVDTTTVTISNGAPIAEAGLPQTVHTGTVTLDGTGSSDPDGDDLLFHWMQTDGTSVTLSDPTAARPTFTAPLVAGELTFSLTVTDTFGLDNVDTTTVTISNSPPSADAGAPQSVHAGTVTLDGTGSSDPDGDDLLFHWVQTDGTTVTLSDPDAARPTFTAPLLDGVLTFSLTVTDTFGAFGSDTTTVTVGNSAPIADAGVPQTVRPGTVTLDGTGSSDPEGDAIIYHWVQTHGATVTLSDDTAASPTFASPIAGEVLTFTLSVTDTFGLDDLDTTTVTVVNGTPTANAGLPQTVHTGTVTLDGAGSSDPDADDLDYRWTQTEGTLVALSDPTVASPTFVAPLLEGVLTFQLLVTDTFGLADLDTTTVAVGNSAPIADAGLPQTVHTGTVTLNGTGSSDPDGDNLLYHWIQTDGTTVTLSDDTAASPTFTAPLVEGVLIFILSVTDPFGLDDLDVATVTVVNGTPTANAGLPQTVHTGTGTLDGTGSTDPDGDALLYHWVQTAGIAVTLSDDTAASPTFTAPLVEDVLTFSLTVTDTFDAFDSDTTTVTVANQAPTANAGLPQTVHTGTVTLDGTGSIDRDGDDLLYHWVQTDGVVVTLSDDTAASPTFTAPLVEDVLTFSLTVTDTFDAFDSDTTTVTIVNYAPSADAGAPQSAHTGTVTLDGTGSTDPDGDDIIYHWVQTGGIAVTLSDDTAASPTFTAPPLRAY